MASITKKITQIESQLTKLKLMLEKYETKNAPVKEKKKSKKNSKPSCISKCKSKSDLEKFTVKELKVWIKENNIDIKKISEKHKEDFIKLIWSHINTESESENSSENSDSPSSSSGSDSDSD